MSKRALALLALTLLVVPAAASEWTVRERIGAADLSWSGEGAFLELRLAGGLCLEGDGARALPGRLIRVPLPDGERLADFDFTSDEPQVLEEAALPARIGPARAEDGSVSLVEGVPAGELVLLGQQAQRGLREAVFYWRPLSERDGALWLSDELELRLRCEPDPEPPLRVLRQERGAEPPVTAAEGRHCVEIIQAAYQSSETGKAVYLPL